jgi:hypothetical protein
MRTITLHYDEDALNRFQIWMASKGCETPHKEMERVIGYLSSWGPSYPVVDIYMSTGLGELQAVYRTKPFEQGDKPAFLIGAVLDTAAKLFVFNS